ncbi:chromate efflux transporter [Cytophagaceae bacterium YF14B1]|uniref:Chromate efflux transporter n=1 Tax=Xanthocytophaga flava TaxID=3048013 RepID=A0AAE3QR98_9BACT|nr:chromate efflux transporter [Xanthocytophaga flavus]MDJ1484017.1 chromate efflux transporter [Xanthocytophaga flavus]
MLDIRPSLKLPTPPREKVRRIRYFIFLKDVFILAITAMGGPQAHLALYLEVLVKKRAYVTEEELMELTALCSILPGPSSTQTLTAIAFKIGGPNLAYLTLLVWITPAVAIMTAAALSINYLQAHQISLDFTHFIQPMAVGFMIYAGFQIGRKVFTNAMRVGIGSVAAILGLIFQSPYIPPIVLLIGGITTAVQFNKLERQEHKDPLQIQWSNFLLWLAILVVAAIIGGITRWLPIRLFENFYRNGSLIFGGGQVLIPLMFTEFVLFKKKQYLTQEEFLSGYAIAQTVPGPVFAFTAFIGTLAMRDYGIPGQLLGSMAATAGIFLPGTFLIFFVYRFWNQLKQYRVVRASLEGINAASTGLIVSAIIPMFEPSAGNILDISVIVTTFLLLNFTKIPHPIIVVVGLLLGFIL